MNRKFPPTTSNLLTNPECHNAQRYKWTDSQSDRWHGDANSQSYCI